MEIDLIEMITMGYAPYKEEITWEAEDIVDDTINSIEHDLYERFKKAKDNKSNIADTTYVLTQLPIVATMTDVTEGEAYEAAPEIFRYLKDWFNAESIDIRYDEFERTLTTIIFNEKQHKLLESLGDRYKHDTNNN